LKENIVIAAGGTGGHISPGIALAEELFENKEDYGIGEIYIHSLNRNKDNPDLQDSPVPILWHNTPQFNWKFIFYIFHFLHNFGKTFFQFFTRNIHCVIAMGGYSCLPALIFALLFRKKIYLCEQNRIMGKVTKFFLKHSDKVAFSFPPLLIEQERFKDFKILGNPLRAKILPNSKLIQTKRKQLTSKERINVLVLGGSQGARQINNMVIKALEDHEIIKHYHFRLLTGTNLYEETKQNTKQDIDLISYSQDMKTHYEWADLVIARAGAGVISEGLAFGLPMILIPYPFAADNHQYENAKYLEEKHASLVLNQKEEDPELLIKYLKEFIENRKSLIHLAVSAQELATVKATKNTAAYFFGNPDA
jgi:UDP-N-acetylglucosamine--N-acetylmuramyl-(pentapeptide) pyrophosphoryl-undecaprenol N-acetylglucosamine transferase